MIQRATFRRRRRSANLRYRAQRGTVFGAELWEYLSRSGAATVPICDRRDIPLEAEQIIPQAAFGSNRVSNLTLACHRCNTLKGAQPIQSDLASRGRLGDPGAADQYFISPQGPLLSGRRRPSRNSLLGF
jgi:hypothetical protein